MWLVHIVWLVRLSTGTNFLRLQLCASQLPPRDPESHIVFPSNTHNTYRPDFLAWRRKFTTRRSPPSLDSTSLAVDLLLLDHRLSHFRPTASPSSHPRRTAVTTVSAPDHELSHHILALSLFSLPRNISQWRPIWTSKWTSPRFPSHLAVMTLRPRTAPPRSLFSTTRTTSTSSTLSRTSGLCGSPSPRAARCVRLRQVDRVRCRH